MIRNEALRPGLDLAVSGHGFLTFSQTIKLRCTDSNRPSLDFVSCFSVLSNLDFFSLAATTPASEEKCQSAQVETKMSRLTGIWYGSASVCANGNCGASQHILLWWLKLEKGVSERLFCSLHRRRRRHCCRCPVDDSFTSIARTEAHLATWLHAANKRVHEHNILLLLKTLVTRRRMVCDPAWPSRGRDYRGGLNSWSTEWETMTQSQRLL